MHDQEISPDLISCAEQVYDLERGLGDLDRAALRKAISAALVRQERLVTERICETLRALASATAESEEDDDTAGAQAFGMRWAALQLQEKVRLAADPVEGYAPQDDDIIEVLISGRVHVMAEICGSCGEPSKPLFSVVDIATGAEYYFDPAEVKNRLRVRVLFRGESD